MFDWWRWRQLEKKIANLSPEKKEKLKRILSDYQNGVACLHGVSYKRELPCLECLSGDSLFEIAKWLEHV